MFARRGLLFVRVYIIIRWRLLHALFALVIEFGQFCVLAFDDIHEPVALCIELCLTVATDAIFALVAVALQLTELVGVFEFETENGFGFRHWL